MTNAPGRGKSDRLYTCACTPKLTFFVRSMARRLRLEFPVGRVASTKIFSREALEGASEGRPG